ncbi:hypothetical protein [Actinospica robiniae]|uniref:hypothetical protein n=1 Tax=Actinospica robiniae TaxID=304901 RepID=UPI00054D8725|nr:hypothetical protein [Actinospica robiniae]
MISIIALAGISVFAVLALVSERWRSWSRRRRTADYVVSAMILTPLARWWIDQFVGRSAGHRATAAIALLCVLCFFAAWRRWAPRPAG